MRPASSLASLVTGLWSRRPLARDGGPGPHRRLRLTAAAGSDVGKVRARNEDYVLIVDLAPPTGDTPCVTPEVPLLIVADGMGGAAAGEVASEMAATILAAQLTGAWREPHRRTPLDLRRCLVAAFEAANREVYGYARRSAELEGMGTTLTAATVAGAELYVAHVGDTRAYLVREGRAHRLTKDHSLAQHLIDSGAVSEAEARQQSRNVLVRAIGPSADVAVDICHERVRPGDTLVLCCDGLWSAVADQEIVEIVAGADGPRAACGALIDVANARGGDDNISVLVARLDDGDGAW